MASQLWQEAALVTKFFDDYGIKVSVNQADTFVADKSFAVLALKLKAGGKIAHINSHLEEIAEVVSASRQAATPVRLRKLPLGLEIPHPNPQPLVPSVESMNQPPFTMLLGKGHGYGGAYDLTLDLRETAHILNAGATGSGKSSLTTLMLETLLWGTPPRKLGLIPIDFKNDDLVPFRDMPHVYASAYNLMQAEVVLRELFEKRNGALD